ncbi:hypothetical protein E7Z59_07900 [Robertkochia marina]|uniref:Uncharacterized protein n=1 Tax=Robertkochia marina TaxID=1227945 RepID=A0A4S3M278_9FLAO|nr:hypothetical protein [Robertkochia marina]THD67575.1 hypothetical protein E7Z59_07900 [Robertkochia marina]TRZ44557.1 hypothetical protein D3A96_08045 [Robertkochia marina]
MNPPEEQYRRYVFFGIVLISLGVIFNTTLDNLSGSLGTVLIAFGGLLFIVGMKKKRDASK